MAGAKKKKRTRKKRQNIILPQEQISEVEAKFSIAIQEAIALRNETFGAENQYSIDELADYFTNTSNELKNRILPLEKRRYVIYLRKSTDDEAKQVRSIDDQRDECSELANRL